MTLQHEFRRSGQTTRLLPDTVLGRLLEGAEPESDIVGGYKAVSGAISEAEYLSRTGLYTMGSTWLIKDTITSKYIWGGDLRDPEVQPDGSVLIAADGWGKLADSSSGTFLVLSYSLENWQPLDADPFPPSYDGFNKIHVRKGGNRFVFRVRRKTHFRRNNAGAPVKWFNGMARWVPGVPLKYISFDIVKSKADVDYDLELVGSNALGPLTVIASWSMGPAGPTTVQSLAGVGYELLGLRIARTTQVKRARRRRFVIKKIHLGSIATAETFTLNQMYTALFPLMGVPTTTISASTFSAVPYEADEGTYGQIADEIALLDNWFWRIEADTVGNKVGNAGPIGKKKYNLTRVNSPLFLLPEERFSHVRVTYQAEGGLILSKEVPANPNPFPVGYKRVYTLNWDSPPHETLATAFAEKVANYLSILRESGSASFTYVMDGAAEVHGTNVLPGDQLVLITEGGKTVTVDSVKVDADGMVTSVEFSTGQPLLKRWLARRQKRLNKGMSADAATLGFLEVEDPAAPTGVTIAFVEQEKKNGKRHWQMIVDCVAVTEDVIGNGTAIDHYIAKARPVDPALNPIPNSGGGGWRRRISRDARDEDDPAVETPTRVIWDRVPNPHLWRWEVKMSAVDLVGQQSAWTEPVINKTKPAAFGPPDPTGVVLDVDQHKVHVGWIIPTDATDAELTDEGVAYAQVQFANANTFAPATILRQDRRHKAEGKLFRFNKPLGGFTYWARVRLVDTWGNKSNWVVVSGSTKVPPTPGVASITGDMNGPRHNRLRVMVQITAIDETPGTVDDNIHHYVVQFVHKSTNVTPVPGDPKMTKRLRGIGTDDLQAVFKSIRKDQFVFARVLAADRQGRESPYSAWTAGGLAGNLATSVPTDITNVVGISSHRVLGLRWDPPMVGNVPDETVSHYWVEVSKSSTFSPLVDVGKHIIHHQFKYHVPKIDQGVNHFMRVRSVDSHGNFGNWLPSPTGMTLNTEDDVGEPIGHIKKVHRSVPAPPALLHSTYLHCNGAAVSRTTFAGLFSEIGTSAGAGNGTTTFNLPDHRGKHGLGVSSSATHPSKTVGARNDPLTDASLLDHDHDEHDEHPDHDQHMKHKHVGPHEGPWTPGTDATQEGGHAHTTGMSTSGPSETAAAAGTAFQRAGAAHGHTVFGFTGPQPAPHPHPHGGTHGTKPDAPFHVDADDADPLRDPLTEGHKKHGKHLKHKKHNKNHAPWMAVNYVIKAL